MKKYDLYRRMANIELRDTPDENNWSGLDWCCVVSGEGNAVVIDTLWDLMKITEKLEFDDDELEEFLRGVADRLGDLHTNK
jgi:hypothetical protein